MQSPALILTEILELLLFVGPDSLFSSNNIIIILNNLQN